MATQVYGLWWHTWRRHRLGLVALAAYMIAVAFAAHAPRITADAVYALCVPLGFGLAYLIAIFSHPDADITGVGSGYPSHLFLLPVRTWLLVLVPMALGILFLAAGWSFAAAMILNAKAAGMPYALPIATLAAVLTSLQALFWAPIGVPYARLGVVLALVPGLLYLTFGNPWSLSVTTRCELLAGVALLSFGVAVVAVGRARHLGGAHYVRVAEPEIAERLPERASHDGRTFSSARSAQAWFEWKRNGPAMPLAVAFIFAVLSWPVVRWPDLAYFGPTPDFPDPSLLMMNAYVRSYFIVLPGVALAAAWLYGCAARRSDARKKDYSLHLFYATRPMSTGELLAAKVRTNVIVGLCLAGLTLFCLLMWSLTRAVDAAGSELLLMKLIRGAGPRGWLEFGGCLALFVVWCVRNAIVGTVSTVSGSPILVHGYRILSFTAPVLLFSISASLGQRVDAQSIFNLAIVAIAIKLALGGWGLAALVRRGAIGIGMASALVVLWAMLAAVVVVAVLIARMAMEDFVRALSDFPAAQAPDKAPFMAVAVACTPFARLIWAYLELDKNRHGAASLSRRLEPRTNP